MTLETVRFRRGRMDKHVKRLLLEMGDMCFVAGGYARQHICTDSYNFWCPPASDVDIYMYDVRYHSVVRDWLFESGNLVHENANSVTVDIDGLDFQLIKPTIKDYTYQLDYADGTLICTTSTRNYGSVEAVLSCFDFTVCQAALVWDHERGVIVGKVTPEFVQDSQAVRMRVNAYPSPAKIFNRFVRYAAKGYEVPQFEIWRALKNFNTLMPESREFALNEFPYEYY